MYVDLSFPSPVNARLLLLLSFPVLALEDPKRHRKDDVYMCCDRMNKVDNTAFKERLLLLASGLLESCLAYLLIWRVP